VVRVEVRESGDAAGQLVAEEEAERANGTLSLPPGAGESPGARGQPVPVRFDPGDVPRHFGSQSAADPLGMA
jgi:hypothetical protein